jgi:hypothetical protein
VPKCGAQLTGGVRRICERCLQHQSRRFYCISQPAGAKERERAGTFSLKLAARGRIRKIALRRRPEEMAFLWSLRPSGASAIPFDLGAH